VTEFFAERAPAKPAADTPHSSRSLDPAVRATMEPRFGFDFRNVRIHDDPERVRELDAVAYTTGRDIGFAPGHYQPHTPWGRALIAHELAHVTQQAGHPGSPRAPVSAPDEAAEQAADTAATVFGAAADPEPSTALALRDRLRATRSSGTRLFRAPVATWAGKFDTDSYKTVKDETGKEIGVDIALRFKPGDPVNATRIGLTQSATSNKGGKAIFPNKTVKARSTPVVGAHIDQLQQSVHPLYAADPDDVTSTLDQVAIADPTGKFGFRYSKDTTKGKMKTVSQDATLKDTPHMSLRTANSGQVFETTAVAVAGEQAGTYYGSVQWGWQTDAADKFAKLPLTLVSHDVPSNAFAAAAALWAAKPTSANRKTVPLPATEGKFTNDANASLVANPSKPNKTKIGDLAKNTRLEVTDKGVGKSFNKAPNMGPWYQVTVVDGTFVGQVGWVLSARLSDVKT
jgi:uncharacterized protein DUF4157